MFEKIREHFATDRVVGTTLPGTKAPSDLALAAAVILVKVAAADGIISPEERELILSAAERELSVPRERVAELLRDALDKKALSTVDTFVPAIRQFFDRDERRDLLALVWAVIAADNIAKRDEAVLAVNIRSALDLSMEEAVAARKLAEQIGLEGFQERLQLPVPVAEATET